MADGTNPDDLLIGIAAHASREAQARALTAQVGARVLHVNDCQPQSEHEAVAACASNHLLVLRQLLERATGSHQWCVVLEDDALPVGNFRKHATEALSYVPYLAGFYIGQASAECNRNPIEAALRGNIAWTWAPHMISAVAYAVRAGMLADLIRRWEVPPPEATVERRITDWSQERRGGSLRSEPLFYYTLPSLVDHSAGGSLITPSADGGARTAWAVGVPPSWDTGAIPHDP